MLLIVLNYALCPQLRATLWVKKQRELSVLKLVRHFQALADRWMQAIFQSEFVLRRFLQRACATAERLVAKASRKRHTTAQILRESLAKQDEALALMEAVNASPFNIVIAGRAARTSTHDRRSRIRCLEAVLLCDRIEIGGGNVSTHVESPGCQRLASCICPMAAPGAIATVPRAQAISPSIMARSCMANRSLWN
jgi:hypothetical protein